MIEIITNLLKCLNKNYEVENYIKIDKSKSNVPIFIFQTKLKKSFFNSLKQYDIFLIFKSLEKFDIHKIYKNVEKYSLYRLELKFNKNLEFFKKEKIEKNFFICQNYFRDEFLELIEKDQIPQLCWIKAKVKSNYHDAIYLKNKKISNVHNQNFFKNLYSTTKIKNEDMINFLKDSEIFQIKRNIFKFSNNFKKKKL